MKSVTRGPGRKERARLLEAHRASGLPFNFRVHRKKPCGCEMCTDSRLRRKEFRQGGSHGDLEI